MNKGNNIGLNNDHKFTNISIFNFIKGEWIFGVTHTTCVSNGSAGVMSSASCESRLALSTSTCSCTASSSRLVGISVFETDVSGFTSTAETWLDSERVCNSKKSSLSWNKRYIFIDKLLNQALLIFIKKIRRVLYLRQYTHRVITLINVSAKLEY